MALPSVSASALAPLSREVERLIVDEGVNYPAAVIQWPGGAGDESSTSLCSRVRLQTLNYSVVRLDAFSLSSGLFSWLVGGLQFRWGPRRIPLPTPRTQRPRVSGSRSVPFSMCLV
jgi:hypothetical protein